MRWAGHAACMGQMRNARNIVVRKQRKKQLGRRKGRYEDNIRIHLREIGWKGEGVHWIHLAQDRD
jgi:hypothetical protein